MKYVLDILNNQLNYLVEEMRFCEGEELNDYRSKVEELSEAICILSTHEVAQHIVNSHKKEINK